MSTETQEMVGNLAFSWFEGIYTESQAQWSAENQSILWKDVFYFFEGCLDKIVGM